MWDSWREAHRVVHRRLPYPLQQRADLSVDLREVLCVVQIALDERGARRVLSFNLLQIEREGDASLAAWSQETLRKEGTHSNEARVLGLGCVSGGR